MRELITLTKISLINGFNLHGLNLKNYKNKKQLWKPIVFVLVIASLIPAYILYLGMLKTVNISFIALNQGGYFIALSYNVISLLIFFFGLTYIMAYFYFSKETEIFLPLPVRQRNIIISKFTVILVYEYIIDFLFLIPVFVINGINTEANILYYIVSLISLLIIPIAPLALSAIVMMLIMKYTNVKGKKDLIRVISMFVSIFIILGIQLIIQKQFTNIAPGQEQEFISKLLTDNKMLINKLGYTNPLAKWLGTSLMLENAGSIINFILFIISNILFFGLFVFTGEKIYLGGIIGGNEVTSKKKQLTKNELDKKVSKINKPYISIFKTDWTILIKTPIYLLNCVSTVVIVPFILILMPIIGGTAGSLDILQELYEPYLQYVNFGTAGALMLFAALNPTAVTTFSREGKCFWLSRIIPVSPKDQIIGRTLSPLLLQVILIIIILVGMNFIIPLKISTIIIGGVLGLAGTIPIILSGIFIDIQRPKLKWTNPQRAVKQNLNVLTAMAVGLVITVVLGVITYLMFKTNLNDITIAVIDLIIITILSIIFYRILLTKIEKRFVEIED